MALTTEQKRKHVTEVRALATRALQLLADYRRERLFYDDADIFNALTEDDAALTGEHEGIEKSAIIAAVGSLGAVADFALQNNHTDALNLVRQ